MTADATPDAIERRHAPEASAPWLFSRELDAALLVVPYLVALVAFVASGLSLSGGLPRAYAAWGSQFVLGNTTHVILTFLLLGARRDLLHAAPGQARTIIVGASLTWGVAFGSYYALDRYAPTLMDLFLAFVITLASHHTFSQSKGIWSLVGSATIFSVLSAGFSSIQPGTSWPAMDSMDSFAIFWALGFRVITSPTRDS